MKKHILSFALVATMIGTIATGCGSEKAAGSGSDSTKMDSTAATSTTTPASTTDTARRDTSSRDTSKKVPQ